jgi:pathogenesis-related protein 1
MRIEYWISAFGTFVLLSLPNVAPASTMDCLFFDGVDGGRAPIAAMEDVRRLHNCARRTAQPRPSPGLGDLRWDASVAGSAQGWANQCNFSHPGGHGYGENLAWGTVGFYDAAALTRLWIDEYVHYNYSSNTCAPGQMCGHYTQVVWRNSQRLGCGTQTCGGNFYLVCRYDPPGNFNGTRPY